MSVSNEDKLIESLIWSKKMYSLAEFVDKYELPQVVCVEIGFYGGTETTTLGGGQVLTLHSLRKTNKVVCEAAFDSAVEISLNCPLKVEVHPKPRDCSHATVTVDQLINLYSHIKFIRVLEGHHDKKHSEELFKIDDVLKIKHIDHDKCVITCKNVTTNQKVSVPFYCATLFSPLLDPREFTVAEVKERFGFPAKVRFLEKKSEQHLPSRNEDSAMLVSSLGEVTLLEEIEDTVVISTTVGGNEKTKICLEIPKGLDIQIVVAEGFIRGDETYQKIVKTLDERFNRTRLPDFENLDFYQHIDAVQKGTKNPATFSSVEPASVDVKRRVVELRLKEFADQPVPHLSPKASKSDQDFTCPPALPPKPSPKPVPKDKSASNTTSKVINSIRSSDFSIKFPARFPSPTIPRRSKSHSDYEYVETMVNADQDYVEATPDLRYAHLDPTYVSSDEHVYEKPHWDKEEIPRKPNIPQAEVPTTTPSKSPVSEKEEIYQAIARIPQDLTGLSVEDVCKLLEYLGMDCYIKTFAKELVDGDMLTSMDRESLESLNMSAFHVKKLIKFIEGWRPSTSKL